MRRKLFFSEGGVVFGVKAFGVGGSGWEQDGGFVPFRSFHASPASRLRQSPLSYVRNYFPSGGSGYPGPKKSRLGSIIDRIDGAKLVYGIIGLDILVWFGFQVSQTAMQAGDPKPLTWLYKNMMSSWNNLAEGRVWTLVTSAFAHQRTDHLFMNALGLWMFCPWVAQGVGSYAFLKVFLGGSIGCDLFSLFWHRNSRTRHSSLGASGALCSIMSFAACLNPTAKVALYGIIPLPLWGCVLGIFLYDLYGANARVSSTDFAGHLGGTLTGVAMYFIRHRLGVRGLY
ncbi:rhomboid-domain-containing protein [Serendipita vermifera]|nr:rhomboid-domain-containing protein [Serendipita vermifera]